MENKIFEEIKKLTEGYKGIDDPLKRLDWLKHLIDSYKRYLPDRVVDKIKIDPKAKRIEGERRNVTVLFADLSGFTALSERLDAEDIANIINDFFTQMVRIVIKYGGSVDKFLGDALLVLFGAPVAHYDDPERAVRAAWEMQQEMRRFNIEKKFEHLLAMSIGMNTGPAVALNVGSEERMEYTVIGDTVNLAARLEGISGPGEIIISQNTYEKIADVVEVEKRPSVKVKGKKKPIVNYLLKEIREHYRLPAITRLKIVGRTDELKIIRDGLEKIKKNELVVMGFVGDAGIGKTRLGLETENLAQNNKFTILHTRCISYEMNNPYITFIGLLNNYFNLKKESNEEEKKLLISLKLKNLGLPLDDTLPYVGIFYGINFSQIETLPPIELKKKIFSTVKNILHNEAKKSALLIRIEDLQWADPTSIELFDYLLKDNQEIPILFLFEYRSDYTFLWHDLKNYTNILLKNFTKDETKRLSRVILQEENISDEIDNVIYEKSQGNPLFIGEIIKLLIKKGGIRSTNEGIFTTERFKKLEIAESVSSVILDEIDRLCEGDRRILQYASVLGRCFDPDLLSTILTVSTTDLSEELARLEHFEGLLISRSDLKSYEFISPTTYEVIYNSLLKARRKELHTKIGVELEKLKSGNIFEYLENLAYHFANSNDERMGVQYLKSAADKSYHLYALTESVRFFDKALDLLNKEELSSEEIQDKLEILRRQGWLLKLLGNLNQAIVNQKRSLKLARTSNSPSDIAKACNNIGILYQEMGIPKRGLNYWIKAQHIARKISDKNTEIQAIGNLGNYFYHIGNLKKAIKLFEEEAHLSKETGNKRSLSFAYMNTGAIMARINDFVRALEYYNQAYNIFNELGEKENLARCLNQIGLVYMWLGNLNEALKKLNEAVEVATKINDRITESLAVGNVGLVYAHMWQLDKAYEGFSQSLTIAQVTEAPAQQMCMNNNIGDVYQFRGNISRAMEHHKKALEVAIQINDPFNEAIARRSVGWDYFYSGEYKNAQKEFEKSQNLFKNLSDIRNSTISLLGYAAVMNNIGVSDASWQIINSVEAKARENNDLEILSSALDIKADLLFSKNEYQTALDIIVEMLDLSHKTGNKRLYAWSLGKKANVLFIENRLNEAKEYVNESLSIAREIGDNIVKIYNLIISAKISIKNSDHTNGLNTLMIAIETARHYGIKEYLVQSLLLVIQIFKKIGKEKEIKDYLADLNKIIELMTSDLTKEEKEKYFKKFNLIV